jgi:integrase
MAPRKRTTRREKHAGTYYYDKKTKQHQWTLRYKGETHRIKDRNEETARRTFAELRERVLSGADVKGAKVLTRDYVTTFINTEVKGKQSTRDDYHKRADLYIFGTFGEMPIIEIKRRHVVAWVSWMVDEPKENGVFWAFSSIRQALSLFRRALQTAVPELLEHNPAADVDVPTQRAGAEYLIDAAPIKEKIFTPEQMQAFLVEALRLDHLHGLYVYYVLLAELGPRRGEGLGLRKKDIDFENKTIRIAQQVTRNPVTNATAITTPKTVAGVRDLPVSDDAIKLLREQCLRVGAMRPDALVFPGKDGKQRQPNSVTQNFRRTCARLGFEGFTLHSLRKFAVTDWRTSGVDLEVAAAMAGHRAQGVTANTYSIPTMERKRAAVDKKNSS